MEERLTALFGSIFTPVLSKFFGPINTFLSSFFQPVATVCAIGMFIGTMIWVGVLLNSRYVNRGRPYKGIWSDLRLWTVISMLPHVLVYLYFR
jgi:hypothetical protein